MQFVGAAHKDAVDPVPTSAARICWDAQRGVSYGSVLVCNPTG
jgi:hypothetical protein